MELWIDHVSKEFKDKRAVADVSLKMTPGECGGGWGSPRRC